MIMMISKFYLKYLKQKILGANTVTERKYSHCEEIQSL